MARKLCIQYAGAVYRVMSRGYHLEAIYRDDIDRIQFLNCLAQACEKTQWLMHIHLSPVRAELLRAGGAPLKNYRWSSYPA